MLWPFRIIWTIKIGQWYRVVASAVSIVEADVAAVVIADSRVGDASNPVALVEITVLTLTLTLIISLTFQLIL